MTLSEGAQDLLTQTHSFLTGSLGGQQGIRVIHLLPLGHRYHILSPEGILGTQFSFLSHCCLGRGTASPTSSNPTTQMHFQGIPLTHSFLVIATCPVFLLGRVL